MTQIMLQACGFDFPEVPSLSRKSTNHSYSIPSQANKLSEPTKILPPRLIGTRGAVPFGHSILVLLFHNKNSRHKQQISKLLCSEFLNHHLLHHRQRFCRHKIVVFISLFIRSFSRTTELLSTYQKTNTPRSRPDAAGRFPSQSRFSSPYVRATDICILAQIFLPTP